jgi:hypothetical protein
MLLQGVWFLKILSKLQGANIRQQGICEQEKINSKVAIQM